MSQISSIQLASLSFQSGYGVPSHIATKGSLYVDLNTANQYINKNGVGLWDTISPLFTGGTVFGLTATTISATTYQNLPTDIRVTGGTYYNGSVTFKNNTGGTFSVTGLTTPFTGGTVSGATIFINGLSANTFSGNSIQTPSFIANSTGMSATTASADTIFAATKIIIGPSGATNAPFSNPHGLTLLGNGSINYGDNSDNPSIITLLNNARVDNAIGGIQSGTFNYGNIFAGMFFQAEVGNDGRPAIIFNTGSGLPERLRITQSGNIGINTSNPTQKLHISGNTLLQGILTVNGNTIITGVTFGGKSGFTKAGYDNGDILLDNSGTDSPGLLMYYGNNTNWGVDTWNGTYNILSGQLFRVTNNLNESGGAVKMAIDTSGNMVVNGFVSPGAWRPGQIIKDTMLSNTDVTVSTTTIATSTSDTDFVTYSYTPTSSSSYLIIHYHLASYDASSGTGNDSWISRIKVDGNEITYSSQSTVNGNRSGVLFPLTGRYTNSNTSAKSIVVACRRSTADDSISIVNSATSMWLRITEIAR